MKSGGRNYVDNIEDFECCMDGVWLLDTGGGRGQQSSSLNSIGSTHLLGMDRGIRHTLWKLGIIDNAM